MKHYINIRSIPHKTNEQLRKIIIPGFMNLGRLTKSLTILQLTDTIYLASFITKIFRLINYQKFQ